MLDNLEKAIVYYIAHEYIKNSDFGQIDGYYSISEVMTKDHRWVRHIGINELGNFSNIPFDIGLRIYLYRFTDNVENSTIESAIDNLLTDGFIVRHNRFPLNIKLTDKGINFFYNSTISDCEKQRTDDDFCILCYEHVLSLDNFDYIEHSDFLLRLPINIDILIQKFSDEEKYDHATELMNIKKLKQNQDHSRL